MAAPTEMSPPISYWRAYETKTPLWSVINRVSVPVPNQPQQLYPGMRVVAAIKGKTFQGYFGGYTHIMSKKPQAVIVPEMVKQPWMDEVPNLDGVQRTIWDARVAGMGGQLVPIGHVPMTFYSDAAPVQQNVQQPVQPLQPPPSVPQHIANSRHIPVSKEPLAENINADAALSPMIPNAAPFQSPMATSLMPSAPPSIAEKIVTINGTKTKIVGDDVFIQDWVDVEAEMFRVTDVVFDGMNIEPQSYKVQKLDWVKQEEPSPEPPAEEPKEETAEVKPEK